MKHLTRVIIAVVLAAVTAALLPLQVFAASPVYISEIKIFLGSSSAAETEGYTLLKNSDKPVDLNQNAGATGIGSKGNKAVYLGYKTTTKRSEAITDLAMMNMKGGYSVAEYKKLMDDHMKQQIIPFVDSFLTAIREYRENYRSAVNANKQRAQYIHDALNKYTDDDCAGAGLGDLLLNQTKYEMGDEAYDALPDAQKKQHADILTIIAQSNGQVTLMLENLLTRAADTAADSWLHRFTLTDYDELLDATDLPPSKAAKQVARQYDDGAQTLLGMWDPFKEQLDDYDEAVARLAAYDESAVKKAYTDYEALRENDSDEKKAAVAQALEIAQEQEAQMLTDTETVAVYNYLESMEYGDATLLDFFTQSLEDIEDDITVLYPMVASLSDGQRAGLEFVSLKELVVIAQTDYNVLDTSRLANIRPVSIYDGVDRGIYDMGGVALTSDAQRSDILTQMEDRRMLSGVSIAMIVISGVLATAFIGTAAAAGVYKGISVYSESQFARLSNIAGSEQLATQYGAKSVISWQNSRMFTRLAKGIGVAMIIMTAITLLVAYGDMVDYYNVSFTPIPRYMVDAKDIIGYNAKGEKIVLKNQGAYYKAVFCNRGTGAEMYGSLGEIADLNGDVGKQWLALYAAKNEAEAPILANTFKVVTSESIPAGYTAGVHMFGTETAGNLNNTLYVWNSTAPKIFIYYKVAETAANTAASIFSAGKIALSGSVGLALGAALTAFGITIARKKKEKNAVSA